MKIAETISTLSDLVKRIIKLYLENVRLTIAEKLTLLLSAGVVLILSMVLGVFALAFFSGAAIEALALVLEPWASYLIMGGFFVVLIVLTIVLRKQLIINPIARFITKLVYDKENKQL